MRRLSQLAPLLGASLLALAPSIAGAIQTPDHLRGRAELELAPTMGVAVPRSARTHVGIPPRLRAAAHLAIENELGSNTLMQADAATGVVSLVLPRGFVVGGSAATFARDFIDRHLDALAPGTNPSDWQLVSDETSRSGVRTIGFAQHHGGLPVVGGQLSLSFKAGRLVAVRSQALPHPSVAARSQTVAPARAAEQGVAWIAADFPPEGAPKGAPPQPNRVRVNAPMSAPMILPIVSQTGAIDYREVVTIEVSSSQPLGRWLVYLDAATGQPIARRSLLHWAELNIKTYQRGPLTPRVDFPAVQLEVDVAGQPQLTDASGFVDIAALSTPVSFAASGVYQFVINDTGPNLAVDTMFDPATSFVWDVGLEPEAAAQVNAYVHTQIVKDHIRGIDPEFEVPNLPTQVTVNIDDICNAYAEDNTINFFLAGGGCENTGLLADVVYHEYGHVAHVLGMQPGVGLFDGAVSEGASDYLSATITNDPDLSPGFFEGTDEPLRELDPTGYEWRWPDDTGEVHDEGRIIGGTLWDLRTALSQKYGPEIGEAKADLIWLDGIRRSVDTPSWYVEALITNDEDGDLQNGTPDICEINEVFAAHGLYQPLGSELVVEQTPLADGSLEILLDYGQPFDACPGATSPTATLRVRPRHAPEMVSTFEMTEAEPGLLRAVIPPQPEGTVTQFQVEFDWGNGTTAMRPDNRADEWYETYNGPIVPIWCSDFEADDGWEASGEFSIGAPGGGSGDPSEAFSGQSVAGVALAWPGLYSTWMESSLRSPVIDTSGYSNVRLQYRRHLAIEDGYWDQAIISVNGAPAWQNRASSDEWFATVHHRDREWRFHDVELDAYIGPDGLVSVEFAQLSDGGLEFGGWTVDAVCIVAGVPPDGGCGDGYKQSNEQCDDGNLDNGDGCSSGCLFELAPKPPEEPIDDGDWSPDGRGCGCASTSGSGGAAGLLGFGLVVVALRRRRRS